MIKSISKKINVDVEEYLDIICTLNINSALNIKINKHTPVNNIEKYLLKSKLSNSFTSFLFTFSIT